MTRPTRKGTARGAAIGLGLGLLGVKALDVWPRLQPMSLLTAVVACGIPYLPSAVAHRLTPAAELPGPGPSSRDITVVSSNVLFGRADVRALAAFARTADLVAVQENTTDFHERLEAILGHDFPFHLGTSTDDASGTMLWSRTPLVHVGYGDTVFTSVVASTTIRGVAWTVANVHPVPPQMGSRLWEADAARVLELVAPHLGDHLVVLGDFNAVEEHLTMRRLRAAGLRNAMSGWSRTPGDGWQPSWPTDKPGVPPVIRIDHALHSPSVQAWRPEYVVVAGSDHKALRGVFRAR